MLSLLLLQLSLTAALRYYGGRPGRWASGPEHRRCRFDPKAAAKVSPSVIGGTVVSDPASYSFLAWIGDNDGTGMAQFCGGSLIRPNIVMTAAHCLYESDFWNRQIYVRFHLTNFQHPDSTAVERRIINWRRHEHYDNLLITNDIALLMLEKNVTEADGVYPVDVSPGNVTHQQHNARIAGWGSLDEACRSYDTKLRDTQVTIGPNGDSCHTPGSETLVKGDLLPEQQLCAGIYNKGGAHYPGCGDSGGPLLIPKSPSEMNATNATNTCAYWQVGMVSWSYGYPYPDVFTRVSYFRSWINQTIMDFLQEGEKPYPDAPGRHS